MTSGPCWFVCHVVSVGEGGADPTYITFPDLIFPAYLWEVYVMIKGCIQKYEKDIKDQNTLQVETNVTDILRSMYYFWSVWIGRSVVSSLFQAWEWFEGMEEIFTTDSISTVLKGTLCLIMWRKSDIFIRYHFEKDACVFPLFTHLHASPLTSTSILGNNWQFKW